MEKWEQLEAYICEKLKVLDPFIKRSPGSGNGNVKGDIFFSTNCGLHCEAKQRNKKNVWDRKWLKKCEEEIPLHSNKIAIVVTQDDKENRVVHLNSDDFFNIYIDAYKYRNGE